MAVAKKQDDENFSHRAFVLFSATHQAATRFFTAPAVVARAPVAGRASRCPRSRSSLAVSQSSHLAWW